MRASAKIRFPFVLFIMMLAGCYDVSDYSGDGRLIDNGLLAATDRYVLDFGSIDLSQQGTRTFRMTNLPGENFVIGLEISFNRIDQAAIAERSIRPTLLLELSGPDNKIFFSRRSKLDTWAWSVRANESKVFVYQRGEGGTYFQASLRSEYLLRLTIHEPDSSNINYSAALHARSGGWK